MNLSESAPEAVTAGRVVAGEALTIYTVEEFGARCKAELERASAVDVVLSGVTACDTLGIQVLLAARRSADAAGKSIVFVTPSPVVLRAATAIACESLFARTGGCP